jgi:UDPglucose 6-dehydrogenase
MAAAIASRGLRVIGVDVNRDAVDALNAGRAPVQETGLDDLIAANRARLRATMSHREAILDSDVTFVIVPTPSDESGAFSLRYASSACDDIGAALAEKDGYHLVALTSTVLPGSMRYGLLPILEQRSGKACGGDFGLCYSPEFIALGSVIHDFLHPDFTLIGEFDERAGDRLAAAYAEILPDATQCARMSLENAELAKICVNTYLTMKIAFANTLADLCERIPGGDVDLVCDALGLDPRIGRKYLTGALGYGGPCFPRDNVALAFLARTLGTRADLAQTTDRVNRSLSAAVIERIGAEIAGGATVAVLGLAYKPSSHVIEESQGLILAKALARRGIRVVAHDPLAGPIAARQLKDQAVICDSIEDCVRQASVVIIANPDPAYRALDAGDFTGRGRTVTVVDCWRILAAKLRSQPGIHYVPLGRSVADARNAERLAALWQQV